MTTDRSADAVPGNRFTRVSPLLGAAGKAAGDAVIGKLRGKDPQWHRERAAERYAKVLGRHRGLLMKVGQILSFVPLSPPSRSGAGQAGRPAGQSALTRLQDDAPPMEPDVAAAVLVSELGAGPEELFAEFEPMPLAAASIGQVHAARLADGRRVAVKIQYPGVEEAIRADLSNADLLATFLQLILGVAPSHSRADVRAVAAELSDRIGEEIDYRAEAEYQSEFASAYRGHPFIRVPAVIGELSTRRVLTTELAHGMRWSQAQAAGEDLRSQWSEAIYRFVFGSLRRLHRFNGDPHPGNYLFHEDGTVTFLDFGCVRRFTAGQVAWMQASVQSAVDGEADVLWDAFVAGGMMDAANAPEPAELLAWFRESLHPCIAPQPFTYTPEYAAGAIHRMFSPFGPHRNVLRRVAMQPYYLLLTRIDLGVTALLGALRPTAPWEAIRREYDRGGAPSTPFGELDQAYWREANHP